MIRTSFANKQRGRERQLAVTRRCLRERRESKFNELPKDDSPNDLDFRIWRFNFVVAFFVPTTHSRRVAMAAVAAKVKYPKEIIIMSFKSKCRASTTNENKVAVAYQLLFLLRFPFLSHCFINGLDDDLRLELVISPTTIWCACHWNNKHPLQHVYIEGEKNDFLSKTPRRVHLA